MQFIVRTECMREIRFCFAFILKDTAKPVTKHTIRSVRTKIVGSGNVRTLPLPEPYHTI